MKFVTLAALAALAAAPALAQTAPAGHSAPAQAPAAASGKVSVKTTPVSELIKNPKAKAVLEKALPEIPQYYDQIGSMTLTEVMPLSQGAITQGTLDALQAEFDKL